MELLSVAERNTWPHIPRIRAHCLVEKTLDKCVQRLRQRITEESDENLVAMARDVTQHPSKNRDRTPSFYTSRSIVNLSGLSVADPTPLHKGVEDNWKGECLSAENDKELLPNKLRRSSLSNGKIGRVF
jgi:hypothetical protein